MIYHEFVQHEDGSIWWEQVDSDKLLPSSNIPKENETSMLRQKIYVPSFCEKVEKHIRDTLETYGYKLRDPNEAADLWAHITTMEITYLMSEDVLGADFFSAQGMVRDTIRKIDVTEYYNKYAGRE